MDARGYVFEPPGGSVERDQERLIHLSRPGGEQEGPYTVEEVNEALAAGKYQGSDYWAWYQGLSDWVPLYSVPGVREAGAAPIEEPSSYDAQLLPPKAEAPEAAPVESGAPAHQSGGVPAGDKVARACGLPFTALKQVFILTTGDAQAASRSAATTSLLQEVVGEDWPMIREVIPRDAIGRCSMLSEMGKGPVPTLVWRAMTAFKPLLLKQAREGSYRIVIRTFQLETGDIVSVFLFYDKENLA